MDCSQVNGMLDLLMDDALGDEQLEALEAHGRECPECAAQLRATRRMKALFEQMEPEADVPLEAQARWRGAVRAEARQRGKARLRRWIATAAAAAVVLVGVSLTFALRGAPKQDSAQLYVEESAVVATGENAVEPALASNGAASNARANAALGAVVEADGAVGIEEGEAEIAEEAYEADSAASGQRAPACELDLQVSDVSVACDRICDLAQEYEAVADVQSAGDGGANVYVEIDAGNAGDFMSAVAPMDESGNDVDVPELAGSGHVLVLLVLHG